MGLVYKPQCFRLSSCNTRWLVPDFTLCLSISNYAAIFLVVLFTFYIVVFVTCLTTLMCLSLSLVFYPFNCTSGVVFAS